MVAQRWYLSSQMEQYSDYWCRVLEVDIPGSEICMGPQSVEVEATTVKFMYSLELCKRQYPDLEAYQVEGLDRVDVELSEYCHRMLLQQACQDVTVFLTLSLK